MGPAHRKLAPLPAHLPAALATVARLKAVTPRCLKASEIVNPKPSEEVARLLPS